MRHPALDVLADKLRAPVVKPTSTAHATLDAVEDNIHRDAKNLAEEAVSAFLSLAEIDESDLDEGEGYGDRLLNLLVGMMDADKDGEISEDEATVVDVYRAAIGEYLQEAGCADADIEAMLNDWDNDATERCISGASEALDEGEDASFDSARNFAGSLDCSGSNATMDATYKKVKSFIGGVKKWVKKRVSGTVRISSKMKAHLKRLAAKPKSASTRAKMAKSMKKQFKLGLFGK